MVKDHSARSVAPRLRRRSGRRWILGIGIALVVYTVLGFLVIPLIVRSVAVSQLGELLDREVVIDKVRLNPFTFAAEVDGLAIRDPDGEPLLAWQHVRVDFQFTSIFYGPWRIREITVVQPAVRTQINPDYTYNFSDLIEKFSQPGAPEEPPAEPSPLPVVVIDALEIREATASYTDLTPSTPFRRRVFPVNLRAPDFSTAPDHTNTFELQGVTDAGEQFSFTGSLLLTPPEVHGRFDLRGLNVTNFAAFYEDFVKFRLHDGSIALSTEPHVRLSSSNRLARVVNTRVNLESLKVGFADASQNLAELDQLRVEVPSADAWERDAHVRSVLIDGVRLQVHRRVDATFEFVDAARPVETTHAAPGSARLVLTAFTNVMAMFSGNTNVGVARLDTLVLTNSAVHWLDESPGEPVRATISDMAVAVQNVSTLPEAAPTARLSMTWQTNGPLAIDVQARTTPPSLDVAVDLERWDLSVADPYLADFAHLHLDQLELSLKAGAHLEAPHGAEPSGEFEGDIRLSRLKTSHGLNHTELLLWDDFNIRGVKGNLHPFEITVDHIQLERPRLWVTLHPDGTVSVLTAANITNAVLEPTGAPTDPAPAEPTSASPDPSAEPASGPGRPAPSDATPTLPPVFVASVLVTNAVIHLADEMSEPNAHLTVNPLHVALTGLSSTNLQSGDFQIAGGMEPAGSFTIRGQVRPLDGPEPTRVNLTSEGIDLTPTSPYIQRFLGYKLDRGVVSAQLRYEITQRQLRAENHVILDQFTLGDAVESPDAIKAPVKLGISVLKDREGRIDLTVPLSGSLDDPQFDIGKVITDAFANVFTKVITSPFGVLGGLVGGDDKDQEDLDRVEFAPGETTLTPELVEHIGKIEKILYERPALTVELLGTADPAIDSAALDDAQPAATQRQPELTTAAAATAPRPAGPSTEPSDAADLQSAPATHEDYARGLTQRFLEARQVNSPPVEAGTGGQADAAAVAVEVSETDLRQLAQQRAEAVRAAILEPGRIEPGRVTIRSLTGPPPTDTEVRLTLQ